MCAGHESKLELELAEFVSSFVPIERNSRRILGGGKELDIYIPSKKIAIEFNGNIWHSEKFSKDPKWRMLHKQQQCNVIGIRLIHVAENEDLTIVKKTITHVLGFDSEKYGARKTQVLELSSNDQRVKEFLNNNHLQGNVGGCKAVCLTLNNLIVACMLFSRVNSIRGTKKKDGQWELRRMSSCCRIVGGASKMFTHFLRNYLVDTVISYLDNKWFTGKMYKRLGFSLVKISRPDYKYVKNGIEILSKSKLSRSNMKKIKGFSFDPAETEHQNALRNNYYRLYDCGKKKWKYVNKQNTPPQISLRGTLRERAGEGTAG